MAPPPPPPATKEPERPAPVATPEPPAKPVFPVLSAFDTEVDVVPFDDGATLVARSLVAVVRGATLTQDPAWLTGLPQAVNTEGIRIHTPRFDRPPAAGEPFPVDYRVGTVKIDLSTPQGAFGWKGPAGFGAIPANAKPKVIPGIPQALDGTGEHTFPAPGGGFFILRAYGGQLGIFRLDASEKVKSTETVPLPQGTTDVTVLRFADGAFLLLGNKGGLFSVKDQTLTPLAGPQSLPVASAALGSDGTLWVVTNELPTPKTPAHVFSRVGEGPWVKQELPKNRAAKKIWAGGSRMWVALTNAEGANEIWSNVAVKASAGFGATENPWTPKQPALLPVTSDVPTGPATSVCPKLALWLGENEDKAVIAAVAADAEAKKHPLVVAGGSPKLLAAGVKTTAPKQARSGLVLLPATFDEGRAAATSLTPVLAKLAKPVVPRLVCAVVKEKKKIAPK